jgi:16S rRNA (uracil1498-N3)-methyltransferase
MRPGDKILILPDNGWELTLNLISVTTEKVIGRIIDKHYGRRLNNIDVNIYLSPLKTDHFEWALQKCTEIGVSMITPTIYNHTEFRPSIWESKYVRWMKIIQEASEQSRRNKLPILAPTLNLLEALNSLSRNHLSIILYEKEKQNFFMDVLLKQDNEPPSPVNVFIGPEGGISDQEINLTEKHQVIACSLGDQILRSETAAIVACATVFQFYLAGKSGKGI